MKIAILMTSFNRVDKTLRSLAHLYKCALPADVMLRAYLVDDDSPDGTATKVRAEFPGVEVHTSRGDLFWCRGMRLAQERASIWQPDFFLWLNDDTFLVQDGLVRLINAAAELGARDPAIIVGATVDQISGAVTYGGSRRRSIFRLLAFDALPLSASPQQCDCMTGNIVLIPAPVAAVLGNLDARFEHAMGDTDYALRARSCGYGIWMAPGYIGTCSSNDPTGSFLDSAASFKSRWSHIMSRKGLPWRSWLVLVRRHCGILWPLYFLWPYSKLVATHLLYQIRSILSVRN